MEMVDRIVEVRGHTKDNLDDVVPPHKHSFHIEFDENNQVVPTNTGMAQGHIHPILAGSATEKKFGHSHRYTLDGD